MAHLALAVLVALALASPSLLVAQGAAPAGGGNTGDGSNAFTGVGSAPEASLFVGAATMSIPFEVPPGRKTITPRLGLSYSSGAGFSPYGYGWDLPLGKIQRSVKNGALSCTDVSQHDDFVVVLPGSSAECTLEGSTCQPLIQEAAVAVEYDAAGNVWTVRDVAGMRYTFGESDARTGSQTSTLFAPGSPCAYTYSWGLTEIRDTNDNYLTVEYVREDGVLYPAAVRCGGNSTAGIAHMFHVEFDFLADPDPRTWSTSGAGGFLAVTKKRLENVRVKAPGAGAFVRRYHLVYNDSDVHNARVLGSVEMYAGNPADPADDVGIPLSNATTGAAAFEMAYEIHDHWDPNGVGNRFQPEQRTEDPLPLPTHPDRIFRSMSQSSGSSSASNVTVRDVIDMNRDGIPDLVDLVEAQCITDCGSVVDCYEWNVYPGTSDGWDAASKFEWNVPVRSVDSGSGGCVAEDLTRRGLYARSDDGSFPANRRVLDINGDGIPDALNLRFSWNDPNEPGPPWGDYYYEVSPGA